LFIVIICASAIPNYEADNQEKSIPKFITMIPEGPRLGSTASRRPYWDKQQRHDFVLGEKPRFAQRNQHF